MKKNMIKITSLVFLLFLSNSVLSQPDNTSFQWIGSWSASAMPPSNSGINRNPTFENVTIRQIIHSSIGGDQLRLRFSNVFGSEDIELNAVSVALQIEGVSIDLNNTSDITFSGEASTIIPQGTFIYSDPINFMTTAFSDISVSMYLSNIMSDVTSHRSGLQTSYISEPGNYTQDNSFVVAEETQRIYFLSGLEVSTNRSTSLMVAYGDSITNGTGSTADENKRWTNLLAERLNGEVGVLNQGIAGNRLLHDFVGQNALGRFDRDVLSWQNLSHIIVMIGINDIGYPRYPSSVFDQGVDFADISVEELITGYQLLIDQAHAKGIKIFGATLTPFNGSGYFTVAGEEKRQLINTWFRESGEFDAVIDFDLALRDPNDLSKIKSEYQKDWLHPNDLGYEVMANTVDLTLFD